MFNIDNGGEPEIFLDYWPPSEDAITLLVYKKVRGTYREYMKLHAPTMGYAGGAWFLNESPIRKALFTTRCGGSIGDCLYYLNFKTRVLEQISDDSVQADPIFENIGQHPTAAIFLTNRGYDRSATQGADLLRWQDDTYRVWWPNWRREPFVIYAQMSGVGGDDQKEIVAVLDPAGVVVPYGDAKESTERELGIWKLSGDVWSLVDKTPLPAVKDQPGAPKLSNILPNASGAEIVVTYGDEKPLVCEYLNRKITCPGSSDAKK